MQSNPKTNNKLQTGVTSNWKNPAHQGLLLKNIHVPKSFFLILKNKLLSLSQNLKYLISIFYFNFEVSGVFVSYAVSQQFGLLPDKDIFKTFKPVKFVDNYILNLSTWFYCVKSFNNSLNISYLAVNVTNVFTYYHVP